jgi:hypothetical protein
MMVNGWVTTREEVSYTIDRQFHPHTHAYQAVMKMFNNKIVMYSPSPWHAIATALAAWSAGNLGIKFTTAHVSKAAGALNWCFTTFHFPSRTVYKIM